MRKVEPDPLVLATQDQENAPPSKKWWSSTVFQQAMGYSQRKKTGTRLDDALNANKWHIGQEGKPDGITLMLFRGFLAKPGRNPALKDMIEAYLRGDGLPHSIPGHLWENKQNRSMAINTILKNEKEEILNGNENGFWRLLRRNLATKVPHLMYWIGAETYSETELWKHPLSKATQSNFPEKTMLEMVQQGLMDGINPLELKDKWLKMAIRRDSVFLLSLLMDKGVRLDEKQETLTPETTPITHVAAYARARKIIPIMTKAGCDWHALDFWGQSTAHAVVQGLRDQRWDPYRQEMCPKTDDEIQKTIQDIAETLCFLKKEGVDMNLAVPPKPKKPRRKKTDPPPDKSTEQAPKQRRPYRAAKVGETVWDMLTRKEKEMPKLLGASQIIFSQQMGAVLEQGADKQQKRRI